MSELKVWMNGEWVATWRVQRGTNTLTYAPAWLESPRMRSISLSLPISATREIRGDAVANYFDNLLPDNDRIRDRLRRRFRTGSAGAFDLLGAIGRDCVGAVQLLPPDASPEGFDRLVYDPLSTEDIERILLGVPSDPAFGLGRDDERDAFRISIAGAQEKTALLRVGDTWCVPKGATPTTHILKLPLGLVGGMRMDMTDSVENEWLCAQLLEELGLPVARTEIATFGSQKALVVERFDREWVDGGCWIARLPQEDICQATGTGPHAKYEADGGPGIEKCMQLLAGGAHPDLDRQRFLLAQFVFWMLAAPDGHAKNFSVFLGRHDSYASTPLYDVLSAWPVIGNGRNLQPRQAAKMAMAVRSGNAHYHMDRIQPRHWMALATRHGVPQAAQAMRVMAEHADAAIAAVEARLPPDFPEQVWRSVTQGLRGQASSFASGLET